MFNNYALNEEDSIKEPYNGNIPEVKEPWLHGEDSTDNNNNIYLKSRIQTSSIVNYLLFDCVVTVAYNDNDNDNEQ